MPAHNLVIAFRSALSLRARLLGLPETLGKIRSFDRFPTASTFGCPGRMSVKDEFFIYRQARELVEAAPARELSAACDQFWRNSGVIVRVRKPSNGIFSSGEPSTSCDIYRRLRTLHFHLALR
jgi:hypothetical protein